VEDEIGKVAHGLAPMRPIYSLGLLSQNDKSPYD
jgi:hypothetical protein